MSELHAPGEQMVGDADVAAAGQVVIDLPPGTEDGSISDGIGLNEPGVIPGTDVPAQRQPAEYTAVMEGTEGAGGGDDPRVPELQEQVNYYRSLLGKQGNDVGDLRGELASLKESNAELRGQMTSIQQTTAAPAQAAQPTMEQLRDAFLPGADLEDAAVQASLTASYGAVKIAENGTQEVVKQQLQPILAAVQTLQATMADLGAGMQSGLTETQKAAARAHPDLEGLPPARQYKLYAGLAAASNGGDQPPVENLPPQGMSRRDVRLTVPTGAGSGGGGAPRTVDEAAAFERFRALPDGAAKLGHFTRAITDGTFKLR